MAKTSKNLGLVQAMFVGTTAPNNIYQIWHNLGDSQPYFYNTDSGQWETLVSAREGYEESGSRATPDLIVTVGDFDASGNSTTIVLDDAAQSISLEANTFTINGVVVATVDDITAHDGNGIFSVANNGATVPTLQNILVQDQMFFEAGLVTIDSANDLVAIGSNDPYNIDPAYPASIYVPKLQVVIPGDGYIISATEGTVAAGIAIWSGDQAWMGTTTEHDLILMTGDTDRARIYDSTGQLHTKQGFRTTGQAYSDPQGTKTPVGAEQAIDWDDGNSVDIDLGSATADVELTFSNPKAGATYLIKFKQGATARDVIFPALVKFPGETSPVTLDITATNNYYDIVTLYYDGTNYYANNVQNFA